MGALFSKWRRHHCHREERHRSLSIHPDDWRGKHYSEVVAFLKQKYPAMHVTTQAEKTLDTDPYDFARPLSFNEGDTHIVIVYDAVSESIVGFYEA